MQIRRGADSLDCIELLDNGSDPRIEDVPKIPGHQEVHAVVGGDGEVIGITSGLLGNLNAFEIELGQPSHLLVDFQDRKPRDLLKAQTGRSLIASGSLLFPTIRPSPVGARPLGGLGLASTNKLLSGGPRARKADDQASWLADDGDCI